LREVGYPALCAAGRCLLELPQADLRRRGRTVTDHGMPFLSPVVRGLKASAGTPSVPEGVLAVLRIVSERYGLDGHTPRSVDEVAWRLGISNVAVREIEGNVLRIARSVARAGA